MPRAVAQANKVAAYYRDISENLEKSFRDELEQKFLGLAVFDGQAIAFDNVKAAFLRRFPYVVYFKVDEDRRQIEVINILHQRQNRP